MRIVCISDTHCLYPEVPDGDVIIHAGDVSMSGEIQEIVPFFRWFGHLPHKHKILIGGNHDRALESIPVLFDMRGIHYLNDNWVEVDGLFIGGSPVTRKFGHICSFMKEGIALQDHWKDLAGGVDILVTHGPPYGILDRTHPAGQQLGDVDLFAAIQRIKPKLHVFGHIHGGYGIKRMNGVTFVNASHCNKAYSGVNEPIIIDWESL